MNPAIPLGTSLALLAVGLSALLVLSAVFLLWGARLAGIERRSFVRAIGTIFLGHLAWFAVIAMFNAAPIVGTGAGLLLGFCVSAAVMAPIFDTTFGKALAANLFAWLLPPLLLAGLVLLGFAVFGVLILFLA